eukprot:gnl/TRDRNA2_/TRDRNA2_177281_c0_seq10.p1 gnl/TRDRNA2_/TRDRNA2_177281_c0~~gnl/TRDRNA2_/TRDRNA2_177281_c0_seq10.p1  ORF type:complete len:579 (+),score=71.72 gnl/TRDRNA2_/TRDRNA2_177281_c0_seq10:53-1789(+)
MRLVFDFSMAGLMALLLVSGHIIQTARCVRIVDARSFDRKDLAGKKEQNDKEADLDGVFQCPALYAVDSNHSTQRYIVPTLQHRAVSLTERLAAKQELGPIFWAHNGDRCELVLGDDKLASQLFEQDGIALHRKLKNRDKEILREWPGVQSGMKWKDGANWKRQREAIMAKVLTSDAKYARGEAAAPSAIECFSERLRGAAAAAAVAGQHCQGSSSGNSSASRWHRVREINKLAQKCMAEFIVSAVFGEHPFKARKTLAKDLAHCGAQECIGESGIVGGIFGCMHDVVWRETETRLQRLKTVKRAVDLSSSSTSDEKSSKVREDPNHASLLSRLLDLHTNDGVLSKKEVVGNALSFVAAGWQTSTETLINTLWPLVAWRSFPWQSPEGLQRRLAAASEKGGSEPVTPLAAQLLAETLRWRPPVSYHAGRSIQPIRAEYGDRKYDIPTGTRLTVDLQLLNAPPAEGFLARWDPTGQLAGVGTSTSYRKWQHPRRTNYEATEFAGGVGARHCPGGKMARIGMARILEALFRDWEIQLSCSPEEEAERFGAWLKMSGRCDVRGTELEVIVRRRRRDDSFSG